MTTQQFGERIKRNEDPKLLTGRALFTDDVHLPGMLHAAFVRSPYAHARLVSIDKSAALEREGVVAVYTAEDLGDYWRKGPLLVSETLYDNVKASKLKKIVAVSSSNGSLTGPRAAAAPSSIGAARPRSTARCSSLPNQ